MFEQMEDYIRKAATLNLKVMKEEFWNLIEIKIIQEALRRTYGRKGKAAQLLGIDVKTVYNKLRYDQDMNEKSRQSSSDFSLTGAINE